MAIGCYLISESAYNHLSLLITEFLVGRGVSKSGIALDLELFGGLYCANFIPKNYQQAQEILMQMSLIFIYLFAISKAIIFAKMNSTLDTKANSIREIVWLK